MPLRSILPWRIWGDWLSSLVLITQDNAGHSATRDISHDQNQRLGQIIHQLKQE
ncbi:virulence factor SrfC family protein [Aeromonas veronii]|uniref:virulence factor SrfC family protein n=1 Tax=Aeromonas veronii TaxID=654 RepID=UPI00311CC352